MTYNVFGGTLNPTHSLTFGTSENVYQQHIDILRDVIVGIFHLTLHKLQFLPADAYATHE